MADTFKINVKANLDAMASDSKFVDVADGEDKVFRFAPPVAENGLIFYKTFNHYKLKNPDEKDRGIALADLRFHGTDETGREDYIARLSEVLEKHRTSATEKKIGKDIRGNRRYYAQGWEGTRMDDGTFKWSRCKLLSLPKTAAEKVMKILKNQQTMGEVSAVDPDEGQALIVSREGTGFNTKYAADRSGVKVSLDEIIPDWRKQLYQDVYAALDLKIYPPEEQKKVARFTYPDLDWDKLESEYDL